MKKTVYFLAYTAILVIAILLLIFSGEILSSPDPKDIRNTVLGAGILFIVIGAIFFMIYVIRTDAAGEQIKTRPWYYTGAALLSILWGLALAIFTGPMTSILAITLGVSLILLGLSQIIWISSTAKKSGVSAWWIIVPVIAVAAGVVDLILIYDSTNADKSGYTATLLSGIVLLCVAINGYISLKNIKHAHEKAKAKIVKELVAANETDAAAAVSALDKEKAAKEKDEKTEATTSVKPETEEKKEATEESKAETPDKKGETAGSESAKQ